MKKLFISILIVTLVIGILPMTLYASTASYNMKMQYDAYYNKLTFDSTASLGKNTKYYTIGFKFYFTQNGKPYFDYIALDPSWNYKTTTDTVKNTGTWYYAIPFKDYNIYSNTITGHLLDKYKGNQTDRNNVLTFFNKGGKIYVDYIFTVSINGKLQGDFLIGSTTHSDSFTKDGVKFWGDVYFTLPEIRNPKGFSWSKDTYDGFEQYYGKYCEFPPQDVELKPSTSIISRDKAVNGTVISTSTRFFDDEAIILYGDQSIFPKGIDEDTYVKNKYYKWEYKDTSSSSYTELNSSKYLNAVSPKFPQLATGSYNVRLTTWYSTNNNVQHTEIAHSTTITMYIDESPKDARVVPALTVDPNKEVTQEQIDSNAIIKFNATGSALLKNFSDTSKITKWSSNHRKDPSGAGDQFHRYTCTTDRTYSAISNESVTYVSSLGLSHSSTHEYSFSASLLKNQDSCTVKIAYKPVAIVNGKEIAGELIYGYITFTKKGTPPPPDPNNEPPVAVLTAPGSVTAGDIVDLSGKNSYDTDGTIVSYHMWVDEGLTWSSDKMDDIIVFPLSSQDRFTVYLTVVDDKGASDTVSKTISVARPVPVPFITVTGKLKENRITYFDVNSSYSPVMYPVNFSKTVWSIAPVAGTGATSSAIRIMDKISTDPALLTSDPYNPSLLYGKGLIAIGFKTAGQYEITVTVENTAGLTGTTTYRVTIKEDVAPISKFTSIENFYRETEIDGMYYGELTVTDESYSADGDFIKYRKISAVYDSNNNGTFGDTGDTIIVLNESSDPDYIENNKTFTVMIPNVGKYEINVRVIEGFVP